MKMKTVGNLLFAGAVAILISGTPLCAKDTENTSGTAQMKNAEATDTSSSTTAKADNTARNFRDRGSQTLTPLKQSNSKADIAITRKIRRGIREEKGFSVNANNVKIITIKGQVTLRGPVNSAEEKQRIGEIANQAAQAKNVDNQLEVKTEEKK